MTLLAPMSLLVGALVAMPLVLALYLLKLRRRPMRVGSMMFWPQAAEDVQANVPLRWLRPSLLLLLHVLMLACLLLALGRPAIGGSGISGERVVLLIDASASMSARDAGSSKTRLERAKQRAKELCEQLSGGWFRPASRIAVVGFAHRPKIASGFSSSPTMLGAAIESITPTDQPGDLDAALALIDALLTSERADAAEESHEPVTIVLLSDGAFDAEKDREAIRRAAGPVRFERIGPAEPTPTRNAGLVALSAQRDGGDPRLVRVFARVAHNQPDSLDLPIALAIDGVVTQRRAVATARTMAGEPLAQAQVVFEVSLPGPGVVSVRIDLPGDALASDDSAHCVLDGITALRLAIVRAVPHAASQTSDGDWFLGDVLRELAGEEVPVIGLDAAQRPDAPFDVLVFDRCAPGALPAMPSITLGACPPLQRLHTLGRTFEPRAGSVFWNREHPLLAGLTLDTLVVRQAMSLEVRDVQEAAAAPTPAPTIVVRSNNSPLIAVQREGSHEHVVVAFALQDSNWPLQAGFAIFLANATEYLSAARSGRVGRFFSTTQGVQVRVDGRAPASLVGPIEVPLRSGTADRDELVELSAGVLERAGVYVVRGSQSNGRGDRAVCVNLLNTTESSLAAPDQVRIDGVPLEGSVSTPAPREVWSWFVLGLLVLLVAEWLVYARQARA